MQIVTARETSPSRDTYMITVGMFDGVHVGHRRLLETLASQAKIHRMKSLVVTFTGHPLEIVAPDRTPRLITTHAHRLELLEKSGVEKCLLIQFNETLQKMDAGEFLRYLHTMFPVGGIVAGYNNSFGRKDGMSLEEAATDTGVFFTRALPVKYGTSFVSSTAIRDNIAICRINEANGMLGRSFSLSGSVVHGKEIGRTLGFPTANISPLDSHTIVPGNGVYACMAKIEGLNSAPLKAMVNIGINPTVGSAGATNIEAHVLRLPPHTDLYGRTVTLYFVGFLRNEQRFASLEELKKKLREDFTRTEALFNSHEFPIFADT